MYARRQPLMKFGTGRRKLHDELFTSDNTPSKCAIRCTNDKAKLAFKLFDAHRDWLQQMLTMGVGRRDLFDDLFMSENAPMKRAIHSAGDEEMNEYLMLQAQQEILRRIMSFGDGPRKLHDDLFFFDKRPALIGIEDLGDEDLCHSQVEISSCSVPGCTFTAESLLDIEIHYSKNHTYTCQQCKKILPTPHLLDLHLQEIHDSFFAVMSTKKPSYCCYIEDCKEKFQNSEERITHCVAVHNLPKGFRFDIKRKNKKKKSEPKPMDLDANDEDGKEIIFTNSKNRVFPKYTGRRFTGVTPSTSASANIDEIMTDLQENLPSSS